MLNAKDIVAAQAKKINKRHESFKQIIEQCNKQIKKSIEIERNITFTLFEVPEFLIGFPLFDLNECITYLIKHLTSAGFTVKYFFPRIIYISWAVVVPTQRKALPKPSIIPQGERDKKIVQTTKKKSGKFVLNF